MTGGVSVVNGFDQSQFWSSPIASVTNAFVGSCRSLNRLCRRIGMCSMARLPKLK